MLNEVLHYEIIKTLRTECNVDFRFVEEMSAMASPVQKIEIYRLIGAEFPISTRFVAKRNFYNLFRAANVFAYAELVGYYTIRNLRKIKSRDVVYIYYYVILKRIFGADIIYYDVAKISSAIEFVADPAEILDLVMELADPACSYFNASVDLCAHFLRERNHSTATAYFGGSKNYLLDYQNQKWVIDNYRQRV